MKEFRVNDFVVSKFVGLNPAEVKKNRKTKVEHENRTRSVTGAIAIIMQTASWLTFPRCRIFPEPDFQDVQGCTKNKRLRWTLSLFTRHVGNIAILQLFLRGLGLSFYFAVHWSWKWQSSRMQYMQGTLPMVSINYLKIKLHNGTQHAHNADTWIFNKYFSARFIYLNFLRFPDF